MFGGDVRGGGADCGFRLGQSFADREQARDDALDIGIDHGRVPAEGDRGNRSCGIFADPGQRSKLALAIGKDALMLVAHAPRAGKQVARAGIITQPGPRRHYVGVISFGERR